MSTKEMKDTGYACMFMDDGKPGPCNWIADWLFKKNIALCKFHASYILSVDYFNQYGEPEELK